MINEKKVILQYDAPKILLDELSTIDEYNAGDPDTVKAIGDKQELVHGALMPFVVINSYTVKSIDYLKIDMNSQIPELLIVFRIQETEFLYSSYPKDGDLLCLYIKSHSESYKPIRHDYSIVEVISKKPEEIRNMPKSHSSTSYYYTFIIKAQLRIPKLFQNKCKAYSNKTSWETLREIAKELNLGFSSNEKNTNDKMTWINPNLTYSGFIDDVVSSSWKSEEDAFEWWIDPYYNLTMVNINKQLFGPDSEDSDMILPAMGPNFGVFGGVDSSQKVGNLEIPLFLTNNPHWSKYPFFIKSYSVSNNSGYVTNKWGYKTVLQFYDSNLKNQNHSEKYINYPIESVTPKSIGEGDILLRGRPNETVYQDEFKKEWIGTKYTENTHENIQQAPKQNLINKMENYKIFLDIELESYTPWIYRGQLVPVQIIHTDAWDTQGLIGSDEKDTVYKAGEPISNRFLSGKYIILGTSIEYRDGVLKTILRLGKRQWTINEGVASKPEPIIS